jgi:hypothetical protein
MTAEFDANLRIHEGQQFAVNAAALQAAMIAAEAGNDPAGSALQTAIVEYLNYLSVQGRELREQPGTMAEFAAVMHHYLPVPALRAPTSDLRLVLTDLSVLYAANYLHIGGQSSSYYDEWQRRRADDFKSDFYDARPFLDQGAQAVVADETLDLPTKTLIFELMAEVLHSQVFKPADQLSSIEAKARLTPSQLFALQIWQRHEGRGKSVDALEDFFSPVSGSIENTLLYWIADPAPKNAQIARFSEHLFKHWGWIHPVDYGAVSDQRLHAVPATDPQRELDAFRNDRLVSVARRRIAEADRPFPSVLTNVASYGFEPIPILPVGYSEYGKTSFLCALADRTIANGGKLDGALGITLNELRHLLRTRGDNWRQGNLVRTLDSSHYRLGVGRADTESAHWPTFELSDYVGEAIDSDTPDAAEFSARLKGACGLFFFLDDRAFPKADTKAVFPADELATGYEEWLRAFLAANASKHLPIAIVINKADRIFGSGWAEMLGTTSIVVEGTQRGISLGTGTDGDPKTPYGRLRHAISYNKAVGRNADAQELLLQFVDRFEAFFKTMLGATYRYQILLSTSINDPEGKGPVVNGVAEAMSWMINQLLPAYEQQAASTLAADLTVLNSTIAACRKKLADAKAFESRWKRSSDDLQQRHGAARPMAMQLWDQFVGKTPAKLQASIEYNAKELKAGLESVCTIAKVKGYPDVEVAPFPARLQAANQAVADFVALQSHLETLRRALPPDPVAAAGS